MSGCRYDLGTIGVLWSRDLQLFFRQRSRVIGSLLTILLFWLALGAGFAPSFSMPDGETGYLEYFFPGAVLMLLLQVSIGATMSVIEDRRQGFLRGVLVAPGSRASLAVGKISGSATVALLHGLLFAAAAPLAGLSYAEIDWVALVGFATLAAIALTAMGFVIAWVLDSIQGYHVVMNVVLFPAWILSGAMFPPADLHPVLRLLLQWNPMTYFMAGIRGSFYSGSAAPGLETRAWGGGPGMAVAIAIAAAWVAVACWVATKRPGTDRP